MTGITPMISKPVRSCQKIASAGHFARRFGWIIDHVSSFLLSQSKLAWTQAMRAAHSKGVPVSIDFNHRKQLGEELSARRRPVRPLLSSDACDETFAQARWMSSGQSCSLT